jgi:hypothetical protein
MGIESISDGLSDLTNMAGSGASTGPCLKNHAV